MAAQEVQHDLHGSCACGRNHYTIALPQSDVHSAIILLDNSAASRRTHSAPLTAYLSIPLLYYASATHAYYPDETHRSIKKSYDVPSISGPSSTSVQQRHFCGYCGTHFAAWDDSTSESSERMRVALESVDDDDMAKLYKLGLLFDEDEADGDAEEPDNDDEADEEPADTAFDTGEGGVLLTREGRTAENGQTVTRHYGGKGAPWFEEMVENSRLGRIRRTQGGGVNSNGARVEWSVVEIDGTGGEDEVIQTRTTSTVGNGKRKAGEAEVDEGGGDVRMT